jgi:hypothetical protein
MLFPYIKNILTIFREQQLSTVVFIFLTTLIVFLIYTAILIKFYKRKRNYENLREESLKDFHPLQNKIQFSATTIFIIPISFELPSATQKSNVSLKKIRRIPGNGSNSKEIFEKPQRTKTTSTLSRGFSFHVSYIKSSNYVLIILLSFCIFHAPLFIYQATELGRWVKSVLKNHQK